MINDYVNYKSDINLLAHKFKGGKCKLKKGKFEEQLVIPYLPNKIVPPEYIRDVIEEANQDFPSLDFDYDLPHKWRNEEYQEKYEELERQMIEILAWRTRWFVQKIENKKLF